MRNGNQLEIISYTTILICCVDFNEDIQQTKDLAKVHYKIRESDKTLQDMGVIS